MAPRHTQGCGGAACLATALFLVPNKPRTGVLVSLSHPLLTQASTQLYTFSGFGLTPPGLGRLWGHVGFGSGFASFLGCQPYSCLADPEISAFPGCLQRACPVAPKRPRSRPQKLKVAGWSPKRGSCPSIWRCSSRSTNFLGLHSSSKRWCE